MAKPRTIDTHTHILTQETAALMSKAAPKVPVTITPTDAESAALDVGGVVYRPFPTGGFDIARRLRDMDAAGVDVHVLSATPQTYLYNQEPALGAVLSAIQNDQMAKHIAAHPDRFMGIATLPMQASGARGRRAQARHDQARVARLDVRLQHHGQEPGRSELRAAVGDRGRARRVHVHPSQQRRRRRPAEVLLSAKPDRQSARHHHCGGLSLIRRRARPPSEADVHARSWRRLHALSGGALGARLESAARAEEECVDAAEEYRQAFHVRHHPAFRQNAGSDDRPGWQRPRAARQRLSLRHGHARLRAATCGH